MASRYEQTSHPTQTYPSLLGRLLCLCLTSPFSSCLLSSFSSSSSPRVLFLSLVYLHYSLFSFWLPLFCFFFRLICTSFFSLFFLIFQRISSSLSQSSFPLSSSLSAYSLPSYPPFPPFLPSIPSLHILHSLPSYPPLLPTNTPPSPLNTIRYNCHLTNNSGLNEAEADLWDPFWHKL